MTGDIITPGSYVRVLQSEIGPVMPVVDIIKNIGYSRSAVTKAMKYHPDMFKGLTISQRIDTPNRGKQNTTCLNSGGVNNLILLLQPSAETRPYLRERVEAFKSQQFGKLAGQEKETIQISRAPDPLTDSLKRNADIANILISKWDRDPEVVRRLCMATVIEECGDVAVRYRGLFNGESVSAETPLLPAPATIDPADPDFDRYFSLRKVASITGISEDRVRNILEKEGLLHWSHGIYHLTRLGEQFGKVFITYPLFPHRMTEQKNIRWSPAAIERVKTVNSAGQTALTTG